MNPAEGEDTDSGDDDGTFGDESRNDNGFVDPADFSSAMDDSISGGILPKAGFIHI